MFHDYDIVNEFGEEVGAVVDDIFVLYGEEMGFVSDIDAFRVWLWHKGLDAVERRQKMTVVDLVCTAHNMIDRYVVSHNKHCWTYERISEIAKDFGTYAVSSWFYDEEERVLIINIQAVQTVFFIFQSQT